MVLSGSELGQNHPVDFRGKGSLGIRQNELRREAVHHQVMVRAARATSFWKRAAQRSRGAGQREEVPQQFARPCAAFLETRRTTEPGRGQWAEVPQRLGRPPPHG